MRNVLSKNEYHEWVRFFATKIPDETEIQLAHLSLMVAQGLGAKNASLDDFLINKIKSEKITENDDGGVLTQTDVMSVFAGMAVPME